jgi:hypothetical protein
MSLPAEVEARQLLLKFYARQGKRIDGSDAAVEGKVASVLKDFKGNEEKLIATLEKAMPQDQ